MTQTRQAIDKSPDVTERQKSATGSKSVVSLEDQVLWQQFLNGDLAAYAVIYKKYFVVLLQYGSKITTDKDLVKDCVQDLFVKIWNNRERLTATTSIKYYLFTSLRNKLLDYLRSNRHKLTTSFSVHTDHMIEEIAVPDLGDVTKTEQVLKAITRLSKYQQSLLHMKFNEERSNVEIAEELGITIQSVYNAVFKTLRFLRKQILTFVLLLMASI
jgi:RNA polymerase sigma factor (sigma-70 family)